MFLLGAMALGVVIVGYEAAVVTLVTSVAVAFLVRAFHDKGGVRFAYQSGVCLMLAAMMWPHILLLLPLFLILLIRPLEAFSGRTAIAMFLGVLTPAWVALPYWLFTGALTLEVVVALWDELSCAALCPFLSYKTVTPWHIAAYGVLLMLFVLLMFRRSQHNYKGKVYVRSQLGVYATLVWILAIMMPLFPAFAPMLLPLMAAFIGPVAAQRAAGDGR